MVLSFPSQDGRNPRKPVMILMAAAPTIMKTSRLITVTVTQNGTGKWLGNGWGKTLRMDRTIKAVTIMSLSAIGSRMVPSCDCWLKAASKKTVKPVRESRDDKHRQGQDKSLIEEQGNKNRNQHHPEDGEHVGNGNNPGGGHRSVK